jgi:hypothetical protein
MSIRNDSLIYERGNLVAFLVIPSGSLLPAALLVLVMLVLIVSPWSTPRKSWCPSKHRRVSLRSMPLLPESRHSWLTIFAIPETSHEFFAGNRRCDHYHDLEETVNVELQQL